jgi:hypothetical protein
LDSPPPPYLPSVELPQPSTRSEKQLRLLRFLIEDLSFTYGVEHIALRNALATTPLASTKSADDVASLQSRDERDSILHLARMVLEVKKKVSRQQCSSILTSDLNYIYENIVVPSIQAGNWSANVLDKLETYLDHRHELSKHHMTSLRSRTFVWRRPVTWFHDLDRRQKSLMKLLIGDDVLIDLIAPNEKTRLLIGTAIAKTIDRYVPLYVPLYSNIATIPRTMYASTSAISLSEEAQRKEGFDYRTYL